jgi:hypothetical protein
VRGGMTFMLGRREWLTLLTIGSLTSPAMARGRRPYGGSLSFRLPWHVGPVDPYALDNFPAAAFGSALFDGLFTIATSGAVRPALAEDEPHKVGGTTQVRLRSGILTARGHALRPTDVLASLRRAKSRTAARLLADVPLPRVVDGHTVSFARIDPKALARRLASPLAAITPAHFDPRTPDGTGPFLASLSGRTLRLTRNPRAALGPGYLDEVVAHSASDLGSSLRAFESGGDDLGFLGMGLHEPRKDARPFDAGLIGWAVLSTGELLGSWNQIGSAQTIADSVPHAAVAHLTGGAAWETRPQPWTGPSTEVLVRDDSPWLQELAGIVAATQTSPGHEVRVSSLGERDLLARVAGRRFGLALQFVRALHPGDGSGRSELQAVQNALGPRSASRTAADHARLVGREGHAGVLAEVRMRGGRLRDTHLSAGPVGVGIDWGNCLRRGKVTP